MKQFTLQAIALACISSTTITSAKPIRARPWSSKYGADLTYSQTRELGQEEAALLARAAQVNFHVPNTGYPPQSKSPLKSASYSRSAAEVGNKARKLRRKSGRIESSPVEPSNDEHHHRNAATPPAHSTTAVSETHRSTEVEAQPRECVADLEARYSPLSVIMLVNQLRRLKGHLTKVGHHNETVAVAAPVDGTTITNGNVDQPEQRDLDEEDVLLIRAFSEALDSLD